MHPLDPVPAIRHIQTSRDNVFAVDIVGEVTSADVENLYGLLEGAYELHDQLDILVRATQFESIDWSGVSEATMREGREHAEAHVRRCATVGGPDWTRQLNGFFAPSTPVEIRYFAAEDEAEAWAWIDAREIPEDI
ncbi:MAG: STAS/SEC14 domain-containing protein [Mesorhizobium sp.]|nr:STAS/SEC14 domain-containing protein [Mesorhizobium sp.]